MITRPNNWDTVQEFTDRPKLPLGAYICKVRKAVVQENSYGNQLCLLFDIDEGEYSGFYQKEFAASTRSDKKWKGVLRIWLPKDDGSENDEWTKSSFKGMCTSFEKSNPGYRWNWDENTLAGKRIGIIFRNEEWEYDDKHGWAVRPFRACSVDTVKNGEFTLPKDKPLKNKPAASYGEYDSAGFTPIDDDDGDLPF